MRGARKLRGALLLQMFVGSFEPDDFNSFQTDVAATFKAFEAAKLTHLIVDLSNNGGASPLLLLTSTN